jgi:23S rRNA pseudouridine1911/1915/1917 synthase
MSETDPGRPPVPVLLEDNHLLAVFKPAGWVVQGARPGDLSLLDALREWIRERDRKPGEAFLAPVHRLDRPVCGVVVLAKRSKAASRLSDQIRRGRLEKTYRAVVEGEVREPGRWRDRLIWDDPARRARVAAGGDPTAKDAELDCRVETAQGGLSVVRIRLITGRKHQIRAQLADRGNPIAGDARYGAIRRIGSRAQVGSAADAAGGAIALVAWSLAFAHPVRPDDEIRVEVPDALDPVPGWMAGD